MKKIIIIFMLILLTPVWMLGCSSQISNHEPTEKVTQKTTQEPVQKLEDGAPKIKITIGDKEIKYVVGLNKWNGAKFDRGDTFITILKKGSDIVIPYIEIGKTAIVDFGKPSPSKLKIYDMLIDERGHQRYTDKEVISIPVELKDGKCSFEVKKHMASVFSSYYVENKTDLRGFRIIASWGENECEYAFVIKTDVF